MVCPYCKENIDQDSLHCDQCGRELFLCPECGQLGSGKRCTQDGKALVSAKAKGGGATPVSPASAPSHAPCLRLVNHPLGIDLEICDGNIVGRNAGPLVFAVPHGSVSGRHAQFHYDAQMGWSVQDLGSTNGTTLGAHADLPNTPKLQAHVKAPLCDGQYLLLGRVELRVHVDRILPPTPTGTVRM